MYFIWYIINRNVIIPDNDSTSSIFLVEEDRGRDLLSIMEKSPTIKGWCSVQVKYIIYQLFCTLLYLHV